MYKLIVALVLLVSAFGVTTAGRASAASGTLTVTPASTTVNPNQSLTLSIHQNADVDTSGAEADFTFDATRLQVTDITVGSSYAGALFTVGLNPQTKAEAIAEANTTGVLKNITTFLVPGGGSVPAGDAEFAVVTLQAGAVAGTTPVRLGLTVGGGLVDTGGSTVVPSLTGADVTITGDTTPSPSPTPSATPTPTGTATITPTPSVRPSATVTGTPRVTPSPIPTYSPTPAPDFSATVAISPATLDVRPGTEFAVSIMENAGGVTSGVGATLKFDPQLLQIVSVTKGAGYSKGNLIYGSVPAGATPIPLPAAIAQANATGLLPNISVFVIPPTTIPAGQTEAVVIKLKSVAGASGASKIELSQIEVNDTNARAVSAIGSNGRINVTSSAPAITAKGLPTAGGPPDGGDTPWLPLLAGTVALLLTTVGAAFVARGTR